MKIAIVKVLLLFILLSCVLPDAPVTSTTSTTTTSTTTSTTTTSTTTTTTLYSAASLESGQPYFGQTPPGNTPAIFAEGIVSVQGLNVSTVAFSPDGRKCIFYHQASNDSYAMFTEIQNGKWIPPARAWFSETRSVIEPTFSPDGARIYFASGETVSSLGSVDLWYVEQAEDGTWSEPANLGSPVNSANEEFHPCVLADGTIYFARGNGDIVRCAYVNGGYQPRVVLPSPINLASNPNGTSWGDPFVAPDESYLIFKSNRNGGSGGFDNYISYRNVDGLWSQPINLGPEINSAQDENAGDISSDGKYLFFGRGGKIFWVKADFIELLR